MMTNRKRKVTNKFIPFLVFSIVGRKHCKKKEYRRHLDCCSFVCMKFLLFCRSNLFEFISVIVVFKTSIDSLNCRQTDVRSPTSIFQSQLVSKKKNKGQPWRRPMPRISNFGCPWWSQMRQIRIHFRRSPKA